MFIIIPIFSDQAQCLLWGDSQALTQGGVIWDLTGAGELTSTFGHIIADCPRFFQMAVVFPSRNQREKERPFRGVNIAFLRLHPYEALFAMFALEWIVETFPINISPH